MKLYIVTTIIAILCTSCANIKPYVDIGGGWLRELPAAKEVAINGQTIITAKGTININSPFLDLAIGTEFEDDYYLEYRRFGTDITDSKKSIRYYKLGRRFYF